MATLPQRSALVEQTIAWLRAQITNGTWAVGDRIPTEPSLVATLGVSRNTVREAVRALAHSGLLDIRQGSGTYVLTTSELAETMRRRFATADTRHIAEVRSALESTAAGLAAWRRTDADLIRLDDALSRRERAWRSRQPDAFADADATLHLAVVAAAHNDVLSDLYADLATVVRGFLRADLGAATVPDKYVDHKRLIAAIRAGDTTAAAKEAGAHAFSWENDWSTATPQQGDTSTTASSR